VKEIDPNIADDLDPWHFKKLEMGHYNDFCTERTKCTMGNKNKQIVGDLKAKRGLGFHFIRCLKWCEGLESVFWMLWCGYLFHCMGDHRFCIDDTVGLESMGNSICAKDNRLSCE